MSAPTRYPSGVADRPSTDFFGSFGQLDPTKYVVLFDDFHRYQAADWDVDEIALGLGGSNAQALASANGGTLALTLDNAAGDNVLVQTGDGTNTLESFEFTAGKKAWFTARWKCTDVSADLVKIGLCGDTADPWGTDPDDYILFESSGTTLTVTCRDSGADTATATVTSALADDTFYVTEFYYDGKDSVQVWLDNGLVATLDVTTTTAGDGLPAGGVSLTFGMEAGDTGADTLTVDWIGAAVER